MPPGLGQARRHCHPWVGRVSPRTCRYGMIAGMRAAATCGPPLRRCVCGPQVRPAPSVSPVAALRQGGPTVYCCVWRQAGATPPFPRRCDERDGGMPPAEVFFRPWTGPWVRGPGPGACRVRRGYDWLREAQGGHCGSRGCLAGAGDVTALKDDRARLGLAATDVPDELLLPGRLPQVSRANAARRYSAAAATGGDGSEGVNSSSE